MGYHERWIIAIAAIMLDRGLFTSDQLARRLDAVEARPPGNEWLARRSSPTSCRATP